MSSVPPIAQLRRRLTLEGALGLLLVILYGPLLGHWVDGWVHKSISIQHDYFSHGLIGLPFAAYMAWGQRQVWRQLPSCCHPLGLVLVALAGGLYLTRLVDGISLSLPLLLTGLCLCLKSLPGLKLQAMPLVLVALATPTQVPYLVEPYILPLQRVIASVAGFLLTQFGQAVTVEQVYLYVNGQTVEVAPHCAGLKMLFTSLYVAIMLLYWTRAWTSKLWTGLFLGATIGVSMVGNIMRNALLTYFHGNGLEDTFHWLHEGWGGDAYSALVLLTLIMLLQGIRHRVPPSLAVRAQSSVSV
jgi:cyanoexosortase B